MEQPPETRYAVSDGLSIGYQVVGDGPLDLVFVPGLLSQIDVIWTLPAAVRFFEDLASFSRLILYDKRGQGVSDPLDGPLTLEQDMEDLIAVLDAAGSKKAALVGYSEGGPMSALTAATHPDRVSALILCGTFAAGRRSPNFAMLERMLAEWGHGWGLKVFAPSLTGEQQMRRFGMFERAVGSPAMARARIEVIDAIDVTPVLAGLAVPVLVLHRSGDLAVPREAAAAMAAAIPGARYLELAGDEHIPWVGDADEVLAAIEEFLTGARAGEHDSVLATVLFTDIVESTRMSAEMGDRRWRAIVDAHDQIVRERLAGYRGREVKTMGDGFLATFDGPARGIRCAQSIAGDLAGAGIQVRAGLHTGECKMTGDDVSGIAVSIGARVAGLAGAGEVLVSRTVKDLVVGSGIGFEPRGTHELKGVPGTWQLVQVEA